MLIPHIFLAKTTGIVPILPLTTYNYCRGQHLTIAGMLPGTTNGQRISFAPWLCPAICRETPFNNGFQLLSLRTTITSSPLI